MKTKLTIEENIVILDYLGERTELKVEDLITNIQAFPYQRGYLPTEIGKMLKPELSARKVNQLLNELALQEKCNTEWIPTEQGMPYALQGNYSIIKSGSVDSLKTSLLWNKEIITILQKQLEIDNEGEETAC